MSRSGDFYADNRRQTTDDRQQTTDKPITLPLLRMRAHATFRPRIIYNYANLVYLSPITNPNGKGQPSHCPLGHT